LQRSPVKVLKDSFHVQGKAVYKTGQEYVSSTYDSASKTATSIYSDIKYSEKDLKDLKTRIENQGGYYRELNKNKGTIDSVVIGGETLGTLLAASTIPNEITNAYKAADLNLSDSISFQDKVRDSLTGFISGVKGKLFEQKYVEYLNDGNLPDGYSAILAESVTQPGWDIAIEGSNGEISAVL
jgi:hypothetical protein